MSALRAAVQLVLGLHERQQALGGITAERDPQFREHGWGVNLDPMAEAQLRRALEQPEFPWDGKDIEVTITWSRQDPNGSCPYPGDGGETQPSLTPAGLVNLCLEGMRDEGDPNIVATAVTIFTTIPPPLPQPTTVDVDSLRALQHTANMMDYHEFCEANGWERDDYSKHKYQEFQALGRLHVFDDHVLRNTITYYQQKEARRAHPPA